MSRNWKISWGINRREYMYLVEVGLIAKYHASICGLKDLRVIINLNKLDLTNINGGINKYGEIYDENIPFI